RGRRRRTPRWLPESRGFPWRERGDRETTCRRPRSAGAGRPWTRRAWARWHARRTWLNLFACAQDLVLSRPGDKSSGLLRTGRVLRNPRNFAIIVKFEDRTGPAGGHDGTGLREDPVLKGERGAGAFQQRLRDEEAEPQSAAGRLVLIGARPAAHGDIGLADAVDDAGRETRAVVGDDDPHVVLVPARGDGDGLAGEVHRILDDVAEAIENCRIAGDNGLALLVRGQL